LSQHAVGEALSGRLRWLAGGLGGHRLRDLTLEFALDVFGPLLLFSANPAVSVSAHGVSLVALVKVI